MKTLFALIAKKRTKVSVAAFSSFGLSINELVNVRGGGEHATIQDIPIIIPPKCR